jgi:hypothetical protein
MDLQQIYNQAAAVLDQYTLLSDSAELKVTVELSNKLQQPYYTITYRKIKASGFLLDVVLTRLKTEARNTYPQLTH